MKKIVWSLVIFLILLPCHVYGVEIKGPVVQMKNDEVLISAGLLLDEKNLRDINKGISKEITFYIDLFRVWKTWPDEFIAGAKFVRTLESDPIKKEYTASSSDGATLIRKRFRDLDSMLNWALNIKDYRFINTRELEAANYFVRVTVESHMRKLPPVVGYLLFFVPEKDFRVTRDSSPVHLGTVK